MRSEGLAFYMPDEFPTAGYDRVMVRVWAKGTSTTEWGQFARGWMGLGYRFRAAADASATFTESLTEHGAGPPLDERLRQETALYTFMVGGQSAVECLGYAVYATCAMIKPKRFSVSTPCEQQKFTLETLRDKMASALKGDSFTNAWASLTDSPEWVEWKLIRNELTHRSLPPRTITASVYDQGLSTAAPAAPSQMLGHHESLGRLDARTTPERLEWLGQVVDGLVTKYEGFLIRYL
jgi:hypothetical protein